jgi:uncharacterized protein YjbJ (UPF0337 family)
MNSSTLTGKWNEVKGFLTEKYGQLTGDEISRAQGDVSKLIGIIQQKSGKAREEIEDFVQKSLSQAGHAVNRVAETATSLASGAADYAQQGWQGVSGAVQEGYESTRKMVSRSPVESVAIAFGFGALAGVVTCLMLQSSKR